MLRIALVSDTHSYFHPSLPKYIDSCDEIWHAGDIGNVETAEKFMSLKPFRAVYGNIDGTDLRKMFPLNLRFKAEDVDVLITHIGGYPGKYSPSIKQELIAHPPKIFICGHSHILKVIYDKSLGLLHLNPGAAGIYGFHQKITLLRFTIDGGEIKDLEVVELGNKSKSVNKI